MALASNADEDKSPLIQILTWFLFLVGVFSLCARFVSKLFLSSHISRDDWLALAAQGVFLFQTIVLSFGAANGLGKPVDTLSDDRLRRSLEAEYAYIPLFTLTLALVKYSLSVFVNELSPDTAHRRMNLTMRVIVTLWLVTCIITDLFQCALPQPWDILNEDKCFNRKAWWTYAVILNIVTECGFVLMYFLIFHNLQTSLFVKASVLGVFSLRLLVAIAAAVQLAVFINSLPSALDRPYNGWAPVVSNQVVACLSVVTACVPYLKPFMQSIELGVVQVHEHGSQEELSQRQTRATPRQTTHGESGTSGTSGRSKGSRENRGFFSQLSQVAHPAVVRSSSIELEDRRD